MLKHKLSLFCQYLSRINYRSRVVSFLAFKYKVYKKSNLGVILGVRSLLCLQKSLTVGEARGRLYKGWISGSALNAMTPGITSNSKTLNFNITFTSY